ncbi:MAG TPA: transferrin receptor-like dimerization domain-containing protein [Gemmatimonadaceae bacterium]|jgi:N-acetylated-alpha-linked acidic dipeptidase|nr:transferrin receptor-like dimerization domain-containing protein [Gemmatimonadaceae bacterium]
MRPLTLWLSSSLAAALLTPSLPFTARDPLGFSPSGARAELKWEARFKAIPSPDTIRESIRHLSAYPHHVGSPHGKENAEWILARFRAWGLDARIEQFDVLFPTPKERVVELVAPTRFVAKLREPAVKGDPTSGQFDLRLPPYNAYSADGDVTAPLVYVNYGIPADYEELERRGISVKGAIVIARYGASWRGIKPKVAAEHGAVGCLIYSDPRDDGYSQGDVFPEGPYRPRDGVQRGSVADMPTYPGDPLTPGVGAVEGAKRLPVAEAKTITKIPVLPISYGDAQPLLAAMGGPVAPPEWRGALPITYHMGPGPARVHLRVRSEWAIKPLYDVIATIPGAEAPDEWVIRGNHHDAWVNGADDPLAGLGALLEEARAYGALLKEGWRPRRTMILAAWDGEEPGLLGSTEWAEAHADELRTKAVAYLNSDTNGRGYLRMAGSHILEKLANEVAESIDDPETGLTAGKRVRLATIHRGSPSERKELRGGADMHIGALGSGSDYTPFLQHIGIPSINLGFGGEDGGGVYHSAYDDFYWYTHFSDTSFVYGRALAQTAGVMTMRLASAELLPYSYTNLASTVKGYVDELEKLLEHERDEVMELNREIDEGAYAAIQDPHEPMAIPKKKDVPPHLAFAPLQNGSDALTASAKRYAEAIEVARARGDSALARESVGTVNALLMRSERRLTDERGLPGRPWYKHQLYAPGYYTGYGVKTMPAVREAIEQHHFDEADSAIVHLGSILRAEAALVDSATTALGAVSR